MKSQPYIIETMDGENTIQIDEQTGEISFGRKII
jgi:hypothetical protein